MTESYTAKPICHDLYAGLGGWAEGFLSEGYRSIGYDIEKHDYGTGTYPGELILCDVRSLHGSQLKDASVIVASPPCQEPSYRAMPWSRAKALNAIGPPHLFIELFNSCFRIQREASEAAGHYIPMIVENVKGAQRWVGKAQAHFGSFYLWGDVGQVGRRIVVRHGRLQIGNYLSPRSSRKSKHVPLVDTPPGTGKTPWFFGNSKREGRNYGVKQEGQNWSKFAETGEVSPHWRMQGEKGIPHAPTGHWTSAKENGTKVQLSGRAWYAEGLGKVSSKSNSRKAASAEIAKIPFPLAQWIARCFKPKELSVVRPA